MMLLRFILVCSLVGTIRSGISEYPPTPVWLAVARCRANCINKFPESEVTTNQCRVDRLRRNSCWDICNELFSDTHMRAAWCDYKCKSGCTAACEFASQLDLTVTTPNEGLEFQQRPNASYVDANILSITWSTAVKYVDGLTARSSGQQDALLVYVIMTSETHSHFPFTYMCFGNESQLMLESVPESLKIIAVNSTSIVAESVIDTIQKSVEGTDKRDDESIIPREVFDSLDITNKDYYHLSGYITHNSDKLDYTDNNDEVIPDIESMVDPNVKIIPVNISWTIDESEGHLKVVLRWKKPDKTTNDYTIIYSRISDSCNADPHFPQCSEPPDHFDVVVNTSGKTDITTILSQGILYNSRYEVWLMWQSGTFYEEIKGDIESPKEEFTTRGCEKPSKSFRSCSDEEQTDGQEYDEQGWKIHLNCILNDETSKEVVLGLNWDRPNATRNFTSVMYEVKYQIMKTATGKGVHNHLFKHNSISVADTNVNLRLQPYSEYEIMVEAKDNNSKNGYVSNYLEPDTSIDSISHSSLKKCEENPALAANVQQQVSVAKPYPLLITVAVLASVLVLAALSLLIYKKRHSFREHIITKATVAKSNSYKSTLGGSPDGLKESQLLVIKDDWELDPKEISIGTELGQGAFGRVMVGYYLERKVAIKVLKEEIAPLYREDLMREINLLKTIGGHPNIVSVIGACTLREPVALVMEYMPYGNLQHFLKKCRVEGEVQRPEDGVGSEVNYSVVNEIGQAELWKVTAKDMLSFARQVVLAMEYLSGHNYVHRDLAARNVLVGYSKVVKICDFGLARVVYNGDNYYRMSNGRLPVKWMALESLKDRIYTTHSDVWAFGILLWEIVTMGSSPYPDIAMVDLYSKLSGGYRMEQPSNCSDELYDIMSQCWCETPTDRPTFTDILRLIENLQAQDGNYLDLDNIDVPINQSDTDTATFHVSSEEGEVAKMSAGHPQSNVSETASPRSSGISLSCENLALRKPPFLSHEVSEDQGFIEDCSKEGSSLLPNEVKQLVDVPPTVAVRNLPPVSSTQRDWGISNHSNEVKQANTDMNMLDLSVQVGGNSVFIPLTEQLAVPISSLKTDSSHV